MVQPTDHRQHMLAVVETKLRQAMRAHDTHPNKELWLRVMDALARWRGRLLSR